MDEKKLQGSKEGLLQSSKIVGSTQTKNEQKGKCTYWCKCKKCERCSKCDYVVNRFRRFEWRDKKLVCENCLWDQQVRKKCFCADSSLRNCKLCSLKPILQYEVR